MAPPLADVDGVVMDGEADSEADSDAEVRGPITETPE
jgi:hypothetical protein